MYCIAFNILKISVITTALLTTAAPGVAEEGTKKIASDGQTTMATIESLSNATTVRSTTQTANPFTKDLSTTETDFLPYSEVTTKSASPFSTTSDASGC